MASFEFISFIIGLLLGMMILLVIVWIAYFTRSFIFTYCATQSRPCGGGDYYNDPGDALANYPTLNASQILFLNAQDMLLYNRVPKNTDCVPEGNQVVHILYPQYCSFSSATGASGTWRETAFNSNIYNPYGFVGPTVTTFGDCQPTPGSAVTTGSPIIKWDPSPLSI